MGASYHTHLVVAVFTQTPGRRDWRRQGILGKSGALFVSCLGLLVCFCLSGSCELEFS